ncbi:MAG: ribulose bisphosphate carboxylase small subunit [Chloroflexota bacterium]
MTFRLLQGTFSFLPDLSDEEIKLQIAYCLDNNWPLNVEYTSDPHPRNTYWEMWGMPMFDLHDPAGIMDEINSCRRAHSNEYVRVSAYDRSKGRQTVALSFVVNRPEYDPGFRLERQEGHDRVIRYSIQSYATMQQPAEHGNSYE